VYNSVLYHITSEHCASKDVKQKLFDAFFSSHPWPQYMIHALASQIEQTVPTNAFPLLTMGKRDAVTA
jgi:hypothetical protein